MPRVSVIIPTYLMSHGQPDVHPFFDQLVLDNWIANPDTMKEAQS